MIDQPGGGIVPIVMYHSIALDATPMFKQFAVAPALFADHMAYLDDHGYTPLTVTQYIQLRQIPFSAWPRRPIVLTFDDGYADFYEHAFPVLLHHSFVATLYIATGYVGETSGWLRRSGEASRRMLTWEQLRELHHRNIECGAHSHTHPQLDVLPRQLARREILRSKRLLEEQLNTRTLTFAYPYGYYTIGVQEDVRNAGFTSACAVKRRFCTSRSDPYALERLIVRGDLRVSGLAALITRTRDPLAMFSGNAHVIWNFCRREGTILGHAIKDGSYGI
jgi:peptidoglycan/xylan/chitin deacetylase (PgdA/CDA1 family)